MEYKINKEEKELINSFKNLKIPSTFKTDNIDYLLFVEEVDFTICETLLKGKNISNNFYEWIISDINNTHCPCFNEFIKGVKKDNFDENSKLYFEKILKIVEIFKKYAF